LRVGIRDGNRSDSVETPLAIEECLALGLDGVRGIAADSKAYSRRTLGLCLERGVGLEAVRKLMSNKSIAYKSLKVWQEIDCPVSLFLALPRI
jgi:hypothetical protein